MLLRPFNSNERSKMEPIRVFKGNIVHSVSPSKLEILPQHYIGIRGPTIEFVVDELSWRSTPLEEDFDLIDLENNLIIPGFVDTHTHASQFSFSGTGRMPLLKWLYEYAFPTEARFSDSNFAKRMYQKAVKKCLSHGTTTACYFATIHTDATLVLADVVEEIGQRAFVGKVSMDRNSPEFYVEKNSEAAVRDVELFLQEMRNKDFRLVKPILTPRFAPSCSSDLMKRLGQLALEHDLPIQSHISETKNEVRWVQELHPECAHYADVYDRFGLLTNKTVMAHAVYLNSEEIQLLKSKGVGISHCPNSNFSMGSGVMNIHRLLNAGMKIGLGTDVGGGYSPSILDSIRQALIASTSVNHLSTAESEHADEKSNDDCLSLEEAFFMATLGGQEVLGQHDKLGNFLPGKIFDALIIDPYHDDSPFEVSEKDSLHDIIHKFVFLGDDRNIRQIFVDGKKILSR